MVTIDRAELQMLREAARERGRHIASRMEQIEAGRRRLWMRMDQLRVEMAAERQVYDVTAEIEDGVPTVPA
jgi:hypothetical protein